MGILVDMSGILCRDFAPRVGLMSEVVNDAKLGRINDVFNDSHGTKRLTGTASHDAVDLWLLITNTGEGWNSTSK